MMIQGIPAMEFSVLQFCITHQLEILFVLSCFCALQALFCAIMKIKPRNKKIALIVLELSVMILIVADRYAYIYRGNTSQLGYYMVRISNFTVFAMNYFILLSYNDYILSIHKQSKSKKNVAKLLYIVRPLAYIGLLLIIISQFTGFYYTFDENNLYHRSNGFIICYVFPLVIMILQLVAIIKMKKIFGISIFHSLLVFSIAPLVMSIVQIFTYGVSFTNISIGFSAIFLYTIALVDQNKILLEASKKEIAALKEINNITKTQFNQTVLALATAIDAKDKYTHGHSRRVAEYSRQIAMATGKSDEVCEKIYYAALLHDVGKIGISDSILTKEGRLTEEEFHVIQQHPNLGNQILTEISSTPYLTIGAHYHHEKYNGKGYPNGLKGEEIPEIARIIAVADAYDAMTSSRSYRSPLAQQKVREELVKGLGTQFDPQYATAMIHILDKDTEYNLRDEKNRFCGFKEEYILESYKKECTPGIAISNHITRISLTYNSLDQSHCVPVIAVYDSLDQEIYTDNFNQQKMEYTDFCDISFSGKITPITIRDSRVKEFPNHGELKLEKNQVVIETLKQRDHVLIKMIFADVIRECTIALIDRSHFAFTAVTGNQCKISNFKVEKLSTEVEPGFIERIVDEVSYIKNQKQGDLKNLEIAGWREDHTESILIDKKIDISFHSISLPASRRLWHCPIISVFSSEDGKVYGPGFREFALVRFDGESWEEDSAASNKMNYTCTEDFISWENWRANNLKGVDCTFSIKRKGNQVFINAQDGGIRMENITTISETVPKLYCTITGDQVAITNIQVKKI